MKQAEKDSRRPYQDPISPDFRKHVGIWADLERLRPRGDCVLVRLMPEPEMHANLIWIPKLTRGGDNGPRTGEVVAVGQGDRLFHWLCRHCFGRLNRGGPLPKMQASTWHAPEPCPECGGTRQSLEGWDYHPMHVKPGDRVLFWRVLSNQQIINDQVFQFIREESQILGVFEEGSYGKGN